MTAPCEVGILFGDVVGSTRLYEQMGDAAALAIISECNQMMEQTVGAHDGQVVKTIGDEVMAAFTRPENMLDAAIAMQEQAGNLRLRDGVRSCLRVGFHFGPALCDKSDYFGETVNTAALLARIAKAD